MPIPSFNLSIVRLTFWSRLSHSERISTMFWSSPDLPRTSFRTVLIYLDNNRCWCRVMFRHHCFVLCFDRSFPKSFVLDAKKQSFCACLWNKPFVQFRKSLSITPPLLKLHGSVTPATDDWTCCQFKFSQLSWSQTLIRKVCKFICIWTRLRHFLVLEVSMPAASWVENWALTALLMVSLESHLAMCWFCLVVTSSQHD